jgi:GAF domain-containing protein
LNARLLNELERSVEELRALGDVTQAVNSTIDLETVLTTIVAKATQLSGTEAGAIYVFDDASQEFHLRATYGMDDTIIAEIRDRHPVRVIVPFARWAAGCGRAPDRTAAVRAAWPTILCRERVRWGWDDRHRPSSSGTA